MNYRFHPLALIELENAVNYYESQKVDLGLEFIEEIYSTINRIIQFPTAWTKISRKCRRCLIHRFPYAIIYVQRKSEFIIIAIMNLNQNPEYWKNRI